HLNYKKQNKNRIKNQLKTYFGLIGLMGLLLSLSLSGEVSGRRPVECIPDVMGSVDEGDLTSDQQLGLKQAEERLQRDYIHRLAKQSPDYPNFQYLCKLCSVHVDNIQGAHKHIKEKRHKKNIMEKQEENELKALPAPSAAQLRAVDAAVMEAAQQHGVSEEDFQQRQSVLQRMQKIIQKHLPICSLRLYGSCLTRFAFKTSDINIDVAYPSNMTQPDVLIQYHTPPRLGLPCKVSAGNDVACLTTNHLAALARLEPRLVPLVLAFRYWAKLCHVDCQAEGGIPSYSFSLMVIFFLQQRKQPILPVYLGNWIEGFDVKRVDEYHLTGVQTEGYVGWEHRPGSANDSRDNKNRPEAQKLAEKKTENVQGKSVTVELQSPDVSLGQLWLELLRFYTLDFALEDFIISIRLKELLPRDAKNWPRRRLAIEDPFALKRNVARSLNSQMVFEYIQDCFRMAYRYFACPQSRNGLQAKRAKHRAKASRHEERDGGSSAEEDEENEEEDNNEDEEEEEEEDEAGDEEQCVSSGLARLLVTDGTQDGDASQQPSSPSPSPQNGLLLDSEDEEQEEEGQKASENDRIAPEDLHYVFDRMIFTGGKPPTVVCSICKRDGHLKDDCPEDFKKMELAPLPSMTERFREILDNLCRLCFYELSPTIGEQQKREQILASLERFIRKEYNDKAQLCLFGSSKNGFGFRDSDLDICMTLEGHDTAEKLNCKEIIEGLAKVLKKHTGLRNILPITTAKVPIVKFEHKQSGLEGDISLYNTLAQHNTRMLATYAALDPRVQYLGYTMKVFAKRCDIGDASRGSLSSYAYILMVLYFLQQREPPVIPVLQEIYDGNSMPQRMVDGWNAFFFDDMDELRRRLPEFQQNRETVGELWLGLLRFYTEEFDFKEHVISIRQRKRLTTFEKQWTSKCIAIEDPFDLNHNLGAGVSRKMTNFIMKAFINGRKLFGTPFYPQPGMEAEYFFDSKVLTDGELAPNDRCCRICGKIGHYMKDCPKRRRMKKKENDKDEDVREEDREPRERRCFQCGDMGHVRRDCPDYRHLRQRGAPAPVKLEMFSLSLPTQSDTRQTPPYSPQPSSFSQSSVSPQSSQSAKPSSSGSTSSATPSKPPQPLPPPPQQQVQLSVFGFPTSHPGQFHPALGLLQSHAQPAPNPLAPGSWPLHGASTGVPMRKGKGNAGAGQQAVSTTVNLNDPSIIFAQPAGRGGSVGGPARDGGHHWHNHHLNPGALVANGTVGKAAFAGVAQPGRSWEHSSGAGSFSLSPSWPYRMPQTYLQQPGKPFISQGTHGGTGAYGAYENEGPYKE
uniref:RNA uridylyltransferase n=1 Tax=Pygocentrus nattereri TaxID=42514 RepID=A0AAR2KX47_PYGNA